MNKRKLLMTGIAVGLTLALTGCNSGVAKEITQVVEKKPPDLNTALVTAFGPIDQKVQIGQGWAVLSPLNNGGRELAYLLPQGDAWSIAGSRQIITTPADTATLSEEQGDVVIQTAKDGAPQFAAYQVGASGMQPVDYYSMNAPTPAVTTGNFLLVNKHLNVLYYFKDGKLVKDYRVTTGRTTDGPQPSWNDYKTNFVTPEGRFTITNFVVNPPFNALKPGDQSYAGGAPGNPLGTRWMGFSVLQGDNAGLWGIHGTSHPEQIGTWASDGCIRMQVPQAEELFSKLQGTKPALMIVAK